MARATTWVNEDGLTIGQGAHDSRNPAAANVRTQGNVNIQQMVFDYDALPTGGGVAPSQQSIPLPAKAVIKRAQVRVIDAFVGGTTITLGLKEEDGTTIAAAGIDSLATAALTAGAVIECDGAWIGVSVGDNEAYLLSNVTGTYTAGSMEVLIEYIMPQSDTTPVDPISGVITEATYHKA